MHFSHQTTMQSILVEMYIFLVFIIFDFCHGKKLSKNCKNIFTPVICKFGQNIFIHYNFGKNTFITTRSSLITIICVHVNVYL